MSVLIYALATGLATGLLAGGLARVAMAPGSANDAGSGSHPLAP